MYSVPQALKPCYGPDQISSLDPREHNNRHGRRKGAREGQLSPWILKNDMLILITFSRCFYLSFRCGKI